jgi:hypothetical protein
MSLGKSVMGFYPNKYTSVFGVFINVLGGLSGFWL